MSLKKFNLFIVLISLSIMTLLYTYIAQKLETSIDAQVKSSVHSTSVELRQQLFNDFNTLKMRFGHYEESSLEKLQRVANNINMDVSDALLMEEASAINTNVYDGHYEVYIINSDKVVSMSTSKGDVGLDFKAYPYFSKELDQLRSGGIEYKISAPTFDEYALDIAQYYLMSLDDRWIMIGFVLPFGEYVNYKVSDLQQTFPSLKKLDLYLLTYDNIQRINSVPLTHKDLSRTMQQKDHYASMIMNDLNLQKSEESSVVEVIAGSFTENNLEIMHNDNNQSSTVYTLVESSFEETSDDFMLIAKVEFDQSVYSSEYVELKNLMYFFISFVYLFMILGFWLIYKAVIQKISGIEKQMHHDEAIELDGFLFSEFDYFLKRYNSFLLRWKEEVKRLNEITLQDELTQCANRRYFNQKMKEQIDLHQRYEHEFSMIMFDIDDFKAINDTYGHTEGDNVLKNMAKDVHKQLRVSDVLCRIGGEEFAIILPETNRESAVFVAEKIRKVIAEQRYIANEQVTISLGVESYNGNYDFNTFYKAVDTLLYRSKAGGKNCVNSSIAKSS